MAIDRGIITPAMEIVSNGAELNMSGGMPPAMLRYYALYWDKVVVTDSNIFGTGLSEEQKLLEAAGVFRCETARMNFSGTFDGSDLAGIHFQGLAEIAAELTDRNPGQWVIHQSGDQLRIPEGLSTELVTADLELSRSLPVPKADIPLDRLLDFKLQRNDELLALRGALDELYLEIAQSADIPRSKIVQIQRLEAAINDLDRVAQQSWGERLLATRKVSLDLNQGPVINGIAAGCAGAVFAGPLAGLVAGASTAIVSSIKIEASITHQLTSACGQQLDLSYLSAIKEDGISE